MTIPYQIIRIETKQFAVFPEKFINSEPVLVKSSFGFSPSEDLQTIGCRSVFNYIQNENLLLVTELLTVFALAPEGVEEIKKKGIIPVDFLRYMATIAVGAARGVIHTKTEGTVLNSIVLPPINLVEIIKQDLDVSGLTEEKK